MEKKDTDVYSSGTKIFGIIKKPDLFVSEFVQLKRCLLKEKEILLCKIAFPLLPVGGSWDVRNSCQGNNSPSVLFRAGFQILAPPGTQALFLFLHLWDRTDLSSFLFCLLVLFQSCLG